MTAREYCNIYGHEPERKFVWAKSCVGIVFTKPDGFDSGIRSRFLPKEQCVTALDLFRFVARYNMEDWTIDYTDEFQYSYYNAEVEVVNHGRVLYRFTVAQN